MENITHADCFFHILVRINGRDAASCRAELLVAESVFFEAVLRHVVRAAHHRFVAYFEVLGSDDDSALSEFCDFFAKMLDVNDHTVSHDVDFVLAQNCRRQKIEHEFAFVVDDGVSCVVAALIAHHDVLFFGKQIDHSALAFVTPVDTNNRCKHTYTSKI